MADYELIVVATDLSDPSLAAVRQAGKLAARLGSKLVLTYVMDATLPPLIAAMATDPEPVILERHRQHARKALDDCARKELPGAAVETVVREGAAHQEIVQLARDRQAALIVVGMQGHGFLSHALAGSTAERILHHAPCPVLVVGHTH